MIHMLIERNVHEDQLETYLELVKKALQITYAAPGFISGEAFADIHDRTHRFILCKWRTLEDCNNWIHSLQRNQLLAPINAVLVQPERLIILEN